MKTSYYIYTTLLLSNLFLFCNKTVAQTYNDSTLWTQYYIDSRDQSIDIKYQYFTNGDTILNEITYKKVYADNNNYYGAIRTENGKIYANLTYYQSQGLEDFLLYDFNVNLGDTVKSSVLEGELSRNLIVVAIDSIELNNGEKRKRLLFNNDIWIENIGSIYGLFSHVEEHLTNYTSTHLVCFKENNIIVYRNDTLCDGDCCSMGIATSIQQPQLTSPINIFPNPTSNYITVNIPENINCKCLKIFNIAGVELWNTDQVTQGNNKLDITSYNNGIYILTISCPKFSSKYKIVKY